jgi:uroporphyrinogen-III decarboxylase
MNLTPKENYLRALRHENPEYIPFGFVEAATFGNPFVVEMGPPGGGLDAFGVRWLTSAEGSGASIPDSTTFLLEDVTEWKKKITFPNLDTVIDWKSMAEKSLDGVNRDIKPVIIANTVGPYERLAAFMGFEEALVAMVTEPEATYDLLAAITDYKVKLIEKYAHYFKPDVFVYFDDIATERSLFMSPASYRKLIKPQHKRICDACKKLGMIPAQHTCGKAEDIVEDIIDVGAAAWSSVQPSNDIAGLLKKYGDKLSFEGGYNTIGAPGYENVSPEEIEAEIRRCFSEYGKHKGYMFMGFLMKTGLDPAIFLGGLRTIYTAYLKVRDGK